MRFARHSRFTFGGKPAATAESSSAYRFDTAGRLAGVHYRNTFNMLPKTLGGQPVKYIILDDARSTQA